MKALVGVMALSALMVAGPVLATEGDLCPDPKEVQGFKTCADVAKAEAEGEVVVYATNPEAAELRVLGEFVHFGSIASSQVFGAWSTGTTLGL
jgi:iron(III) transport system substrate-binding protein